MEKKYKQVSLDLKTHEELTRVAKEMRRTRVGVIQWLLDQHAAQKEGAAS